MTAMEKIRNGLVVSCQALEEEPLHGPILMAGMARAAKLGGALGIRTNGVQEVEVCRSITGLPVIGIQKVVADGSLCITPTFEHAQALVRAGAEIVAVDVRQTRTFGDPLAELLPRIRTELGVQVMADCATAEDAAKAAAIGVDMVSSTFGFTQDRFGICPDFALLEKMLQGSVAVVAEGGFWTPEQVEKAFFLGVWSVVVGSAVTRPLEITKRFCQALPRQS